MADEATPTTPTTTPTATPTVTPLGQPVPVHPDFQRPPVPAGSRVISDDEFVALQIARQKLIETEAARRAVEDLERQKQIKEKAETNPQRALDEQRMYFEKMVADERARADRLEQERLNERLTLVLNSVLAAQPLAGDTPEERAETAEDLRTILAPQFEPIRTADGRIEVREKVSGRPAHEVLQERFAGKRYARYKSPSSRGGSGSDGTRPAAPPENNAPQPGSLASIVADWQQRQGPYQSMGLKPIQTNSK